LRHVAQTDEPADLEAIAREAYQALNDFDLEKFISLVDPDVEFGSLIAEVEGQRYHGHDGIRRWWSEVISSLTELHFDLVAVHPLGDRGYTELRISTRTGGVEVPQRMFQAFQIRDGKPYWWQTFRTEAEAREAIGLEP
jgi:SnoaL-like protein